MASHSWKTSVDLPVSTTTSPYWSSACAFSIRTFWCQQCMPGPRVGVHSERQVLVDTRVVPVDPRRVRVVTLERLDVFLVAQPPSPVRHLADVDQAHDPAAARVLGVAPSAHVVRQTDDPWTDRLGRPDAGDEVADLGVDPRQVAGDEPEPFGVLEFIQSGWVLLISLRYFALPDLVWIIVGSRKVGIRTSSPFDTSMSLWATCESM